MLGASGSSLAAEIVMHVCTTISATIARLNIDFARAHRRACGFLLLTNL